MTQLRDARLHEALQQAPDGGARPAEATRTAILSRAHAAVALPPHAARWKRWLGAGDAGVHMPWNAALATVALATLVTVLWHGQEVPEANGVQEAPAAATPAAAPRVESASAPTPASKATSPVTREAPLAPAPAAARKQAAPAPARPSSPPAAPAAPPPAPAAATDAAPAVVPEPARPAEAQRARAGLEQASGAADNTTRRDLRDETLAKPTSPAAALPPAPPPPPPPAPAIVRVPARSPVPSAPATASAGVSAYASPASRPAARLSTQFQADATATLRIAAADRKVEIASNSAQRLAELLARASLEAQTFDALESPVDASIDIVREGRFIERIELAGAQVRVTPDGGRPRTGRPDPASMQALREELARALR